MVNEKTVVLDIFLLMITAEQMRGARAMLRWSAEKLAKEAGVSWPTIQRMEAADGVPSSISKNLQAVQRTLEDAGIVFIDENGGGVGVRLRDRRDRQ